jgi:hypothetical protein
LRHEDCNLKTSLDYISRSCLKNKHNNKKPLDVWK